jgi:hypothetical protein
MKGFGGMEVKVYSKLLSGIPWLIIFQPEIRKKNCLRNFKNVIQEDLFGNGVTF